MPYQSMFDAYLEGKQARQAEDLRGKQIKAIDANEARSNALAEHSKWQGELDRQKAALDIARQYAAPAQYLVNLHDKIATQMGYDPSSSVLPTDVEDYISTQMDPVYTPVAEQFNKDAKAVGGSASPKFNRSEMLRFIGQTKDASQGYPMYEPVATDNGFVFADKRRGIFVPAVDTEGNPYMPPKKPAAPPRTTETAGERDNAKLVDSLNSNYPGANFTYADVLSLKKNSSGALAMPGEFDRQAEELARKKGWKPAGQASTGGAVTGASKQKGFKILK